MSSKTVPCPCPLCRGNLVSNRYVRKQHTARFFSKAVEENVVVKENASSVHDEVHDERLADQFDCSLNSTRRSAYYPANCDQRLLSHYNIESHNDDSYEDHNCSQTLTCSESDAEALEVSSIAIL